MSTMSVPFSILSDFAKVEDIAVQVLPVSNKAEIDFDTLPEAIWTGSDDCSRNRESKVLVKLVSWKRGELEVELPGTSPGLSSFPGSN